MLRVLPQSTLTLPSVLRTEQAPSQCLPHSFPGRVLRRRKCLRRYEGLSVVLGNAGTGKERAWFWARAHSQAHCGLHHQNAAKRSLSSTCWLANITQYPILCEWPCPRPRKPPSATSTNHTPLINTRFFLGVYRPAHLVRFFYPCGCDYPKPGIGDVQLLSRPAHANPPHPFNLRGGVPSSQGSLELRKPLTAKAEQNVSIDGTCRLSLFVYTS